LEEKIIQQDQNQRSKEALDERRFQDLEAQIRELQSYFYQGTLTPENKENYQPNVIRNEDQSITIGS